MVVSVPYEEEVDTGGDEDCWSSPKFFLDVKKGQSEDHAIFLTNMFLGLSLDTYLAVGRSKIKTIDELTDEFEITPGDGDHVWVVTRSQDGSVTFWETGTGKHYLLEKRWQGEVEEEEDEGDGSEDEDEEAEEEEGKDFEAFFEEEAVLKERHVRSDEVFHLAEDELGAAGIGDDESSDDEIDLCLPKPSVLPPYWSIHILANHENIWANLQSLDPLNCMYEVDNNMMWKSFCSFEDGFAVPEEDIAIFYQTPSIPARLKKTRANDIRDVIQQMVKDGIRNVRERKMYETKIHEATEKNPDDGKMEKCLAKGLALMEDRLTAPTVVKRDNMTARLNGWRGEVQKDCPKGMKFEGVPINFSISDAKKIKTRIIDKYASGSDSFLLDPDQDCKYVIACHIEPYYCSVNSVWVYIAKLSPLPDED